jgi:organic hydroperoxide reductase OsmC/OhrA
MLQLPHRYSVTASATPHGDVPLKSEGLTTLHSAPPAQFGGPGNRWSPETLLVAALADCFVLTFRAIAQASNLPWVEVKCEVEATLDRIDRVMEFTGFVLRASLRIPLGTNEEKARRALERAEQTCIITNSLKARAQLETLVLVDV